jgi:hypothetical protein
VCAGELVLVLCNEYTYFPMNDSLKSTLSDTLAIAGMTKSCRQSRASGHFDLKNFVRTALVRLLVALYSSYMMCTSKGTFVPCSMILGPWLQCRPENNQNNPRTVASAQTWK